MRTVALAVVAVGCGSGPRSGVWGYVDEVSETNTCGVPVDTTSGDFRIDNNNDGTLTVDPDDGTDPFECTFDGKAYDCPERFVEEIQLFAGATAEIRASADGVFKSAVSGSGTQTAALECLDTGCTSAAEAAGITTPCAIAVSFGLVWLSE